MAAKSKNGNKRKSRKKVEAKPVWADQHWRVMVGRLVPSPGRPFRVTHLFEYVAEKLPFGCLGQIRREMEVRGAHLEGVYMAHDSMGVARYGGRGQIFHRLSAHRKKYRRELVYFSFYVVRDKKHERELETVILRAAGPQMILNMRKVRDGIDPGNIRDYEPGTNFIERHGRRGKQKTQRWS